MSWVTEPRRPYIRWPGGKRWLVQRLRATWEAAGSPTWVEPFVGSGSVALGLDPPVAILGDMNRDLINLHRWVARGMVVPEAHRDPSREGYYVDRTRFNGLVGPDRWSTREAATLFYSLLRRGYNGLVRYNRAGEFNVPWGGHRAVPGDLTPWGPPFRRWGLWDVDWRVTLSRVSPYAMVYADPPYDGGFTDYTPGGFGWDDQVALATALASRRSPVVASNSWTDRVVTLYTSLGFVVEGVSARRSIAATTSSRGTVQEMLALRV